MEFIETSVYTRRAAKIFADEEYRALQAHLIDAPDAGDVIPGSGGIRKVRWRAAHRGKRGSLRILYYHDAPHFRIYMLFVFDKGESDDISMHQLKRLRKYVEDFLK